jgi:ferric-dicitrate binding protein FerR (iron transport regulator)
MKRNSFSLVAVLIILLNGIPAFAAESGSNDAVVTVIQGSARVYAKGNTTGQLLKKGDTLSRNSEVKVAERSRMEIRFPDGTIMRLSEKSRWKMDELAYNKQTNEKNIKVGLSAGKLWANVKKLTSPSSAVEVRTSNAVAGVRGTEYRVNVNDDKSVMVKVYDGTVYVANPPRDSSKTIDKATMPHEVSGPHEVPPPVHEVSMEEWTVIVKAMQQISISPQGVASKPQDFDAATDADDWVRWNQQRDKESQL